MAPYLSFGELNSDQGTATADGLRNVANTAADFVCDLWQNYSEFTSGWSDPTGIGKFNNAMFSSLCTPRNKVPPSPPVPPFTGGQCPKAYSVSGSYKWKPTGQVSTFIQNNVIGPIKGFSSIPTDTPGRKKYGIAAAPTVLRPDGFYPFLEGNDADVLPVELLSLNVVPNSGSDNCGNPPSSYPPKVPGPSDVSKPNVSVNLGAGVVVVAPVTLIPVKVDAGVEINPQIQVDVGGINVTFDAGGVTLSPNFTFGGGGKTSPNPNETPIILPPAKDQKLECKPTDLTPVTSRLDNLNGKIDAQAETLEDIQECACPVGYTVSVQALGEGEGGVVPLPSNAIQVRLSLTSIPQNAKIQFSNGTAPDYYFCGYYSFGDGIGLGSRQPISTQQSCFEVPVWATSFNWSLYEGYDCNVSVVTLVPEKPDAELAVRQMKVKPA